jgi:hypothetical protein
MSLFDLVLPIYDGNRTFVQDNAPIYTANTVNDWQ